MAATSTMYGTPGATTINPQFTMQDSNADLNSIFNGVEPTASLTNNSWGLDNFLDYGSCNEFPFPQNQDNPSAFGTPQATNSFMPTNNMMSRANSQQECAGHYYAQAAAAPSALIDTISTGYNTRQSASGPPQKRERDPTNDAEAAANPEMAQRKPRKQRKKRSKQLSEAEQNEKRQKFLDRNKVAAHKCRQRKKEWTDNLQTKASAYQQTNDMLRIQVADSFAEIELLKNMIRNMQKGVHSCDVARLAKTFEEFEAREAQGFTERAAFFLAEMKMQRDIARGDELENEQEQSEEMSRRTSMQSTRSSSFQGTSRSERHDSGVSVGTPEQASKSQGTPKIVDEAVDLGNGQTFFGHMMANQRLGTWQNHRLPAAAAAAGPVDLVDPATYLGLSR